MTDLWDARRGAPKGRPLAPLPPKITTYPGASRSVEDQHDGLTPPDPTGAVNANFIVEFINGFFSIYNKRDGSLVNRVTDGEFWKAARISSPGLAIDPRIVFIPDAGRRGQWLAVQLDMGKRVLMATTSPNDPDSDPSIDPRSPKWQGSAFDFPGNDFTMLGYDATGVYIGTDAKDGRGGRMPEIAAISRGNALAWPPRVSSPGNVKITAPGSPEEYGYSLYPVIERGEPTSVAIAIGVDNVTKQHLTYSLISNRDIVSHGQIEVPPFEPVPRNYRVKQPCYTDGQPSQILFDNDGVVAAPMSDGSNIWVAPTVSSGPNERDPATHLGVRWYRLAIDPWSRKPSLAKCGVIGGQNYDYFNPSILSFGKDDYTIVSLSRSGNALTPTKPVDPDCGNIGAYVALVRETSTDFWYELFTLRSGLAYDYIPNTVQRWGDCSTVCGDPTSPRTAWIFNQYVTQGGLWVMNERGEGKSTSQNCDVIARIDLPPA